MADKKLEVIDYNNSQTFSFGNILDRYQAFCRLRKIAAPTHFKQRKHVEGNREWIYPVWNDVVKGISKNDHACIDLGIWCLEVDEPIPFGRCIRNSIANSLYRADLLEDQKVKLKAIIIHLLLSRHPLVHYKRLGRLLFNTDLNENDFTHFEEDMCDSIYIARRKCYIREKRKRQQESRPTVR